MAIKPPRAPRLSNPLLGAAALFLGTALSTSATAQPAPGGNVAIEEIVVTAQLREQSISDVPMSLSAFDGATMERLGIQQFDELAAFVPGLEVQEQSPNNPSFVIRGITSDSGAANVEPRVSVYQDGVSIAKSRGSLVELFDVERVEVAKGPQSTLYGRAALIGAINVIQAKASPEFDASVSAGLGTDNFQVVEGHVNGSIIDEDLSGRLAFRHKSRDGYVDNAFGGDALNGVDLFAVRGSLNFRMVENATADLIVNYQKDSPSGTAFKSGSYAPKGGDLKPWSPAALSSFGGFEGGKDLGIEREVTGVTFLVDVQLNDELSLHSTSAYREFESLEVFDPDGTGVPILVFAEDARGEQASQDLRLNYDNGSRLTAFAGVSYFAEDGSTRIPMLTYIPAALGFYSGVVNVPAERPVLPFNPLAMVSEEFTLYGETTSYDLYGDATYAVTDRLAVSAGLRWSNDDKVSGIRGIVKHSPLGVGLNINNTAGKARINASDDFDGQSWRLIGRYDVNADLNVYASYARGRRPDVIDANFDATSANGVVFTPVDEERVDSVELGAKYAHPDGRLTVHGAVFTFDYENFQSVISEANGDITTINAGNADSTGFELQTSYQIMENLGVFGTASQNKARFDSSANGRPLIFGGNRFRLNPDNTFSLGATYAVSALSGTVTVVPTYSWKSEVFFDDNNDRPELQASDRVQDERQGSHGLLNLMVNYVPDAGNYSAQFFVTNALDKEYIIDAGNVGDIFGAPTFIAGAPRLLGATVKYQF